MYNIYLKKKKKNKSKKFVRGKKKFIIIEDKCYSCVENNFMTFEIHQKKN
jgi:hypothetical protein